MGTAERKFLVSSRRSFAVTNVICLGQWYYYYARTFRSAEDSLLNVVLRAVFIIVGGFGYCCCFSLPMLSFSRQRLMRAFFTQFRFNCFCTSTGCSSFHDQKKHLLVERVDSRELSISSLSICPFLSPSSVIASTLSISRGYLSIGTCLEAREREQRQKFFSRFKFTKPPCV